MPRLRWAIAATLPLLFTLIFYWAYSLSPAGRGIPEIHDSLKLGLTDSDVVMLLNLADRHARRDITARRGPAGLSRSVAVDSAAWKIVVERVMRTKEPWKACGYPDSAQSAIVDLRASHPSLDVSPEYRSVYYYRDSFGNWLPGEDDTPCFSIPRNPYF